MLHEDGLLVDHDRPLTLPLIADLDLVSVDRNDLPESALAAEAPNLLLCNPMHHHRDEVFAVSDAAPHHDVVARL